MKIKEEYRDILMCVKNKNYILKMLPEYLFSHMVKCNMSYLFECECGKDLDKCICGQEEKQLDTELTIDSPKKLKK